MQINNIKKFEKYLYIYLLLCLLFSIGSFIGQFFFPELISKGTVDWGFSIGWQREISLWNVILFITILYCLLKKEIVCIRLLIKVLILLSILLGLNHLYSALLSISNSFIHWFCFIFLFLGIGIGIIVLLINKEKKSYKQIKG